MALEVISESVMAAVTLEVNGNIYSFHFNLFLLVLIRV